ncbi:hypothetical protein ACSVDA_10630 [Cytobacillus sp. Hm23]
MTKKKAFFTMTATTTLESYKALTLQNVLIFYCEGKEEINNNLRN